MGNKQNRPYDFYGHNAPGSEHNPNSMPTDPDSLPGEAPGYTGSAGYGGYGGYNADGTPLQQPPNYRPNQGQAAGRPPRWPTPQAPAPQPPPSPARPHYDAPAPPRRREPVYNPPPVRQPPAARQASYRSPARVSLSRLPLAHIILAAGVLAMGFALSQAWGVTADGTAIYIHDFTNVHIQQRVGVDTGALAVQTATFLFGAVLVLSAVLVLFNLVITLLNKMVGVVGLSGCATTLFFPLLWGTALLLFFVLVAAAGFAGIGALDRLPLVRDHDLSIAAVAHHTIGFYAWCTGIVAVFIGMLGQLALRRR